VSNFWKFALSPSPNTSEERLGVFGVGVQRVVASNELKREIRMQTEMKKKRNPL
jgi:hypothetical protein